MTQIKWTLTPKGWAYSEVPKATPKTFTRVEIKQPTEVEQPTEMEPKTVSKRKTKPKE